MMDRKLEQEIKIVDLRHKIAKKERQLTEAEIKREELNEIKTSRYVKDSTAKTLETAQIVGLGIAGGVAGAILGLVTIIPYVSLLSFLVLILFLSAFIIAYLKQNDLIGIISIREGCIFGAVIGFISFIAFSASSLCAPLG